MCPVIVSSLALKEEILNAQWGNLVEITEMTGLTPKNQTLGDLTASDVSLSSSCSLTWRTSFTCPGLMGGGRTYICPNQVFERIGCSYAQVLLILIRVLMHVLGLWVDKYFESSCM